MTDPADRGTTLGIYSAIAKTGSAVGLIDRGRCAHRVRGPLYVNTAIALVTVLDGGLLVRDWGHLGGISTCRGLAGQRWVAQG